MKQRTRSALPLRELIDTDLPAHELERLARVDALLRCERMRASISAELDRELSELESICMREHVEHCASCAAFQAEAERVVGALRTAPLEALGRPRRSDDGAGRRRLSLVTTPPSTTGSTPDRNDQETYELKLSFGELALVYKSLQAAKTLGALQPQDELLNDTIQLVDQALKRAI